MTSVFNRSYAAAIALNNMGVSLLERHGYRQAMETFSDSVSIMRDITEQTQSHEQALLSSKLVEGSETSSSSIDAKLQRAAYHLANSDRRRDDAPGNNKSEEKGLMSFCVFNEEDSADVIGSALKGHDATGTLLAPDTMFLIRIELKGKSLLHECGKQDTDLESTILLYNFAAAYTCLACSSQDTEAAKKYCECAFQLFGLSYSLVQGKLLEDADSMEDAQQSLEQQLFLPISLVILKSLISLSGALGLQRAHRVFKIHMVDLGETFLELEELLPESTTNAAPAA